MIRDFQRTLKRRAQRAGVTLTGPVAERLEAYYVLLARWNARINLTALNLASGDEAIDRLLVEPLIAARSVKPADVRLIDIGSGGGSPAIPLAIAAPRLVLTMVESKVRKSAFLREAIRTLELNAEVQTHRYETLLAEPGMHEFADILSLRAVRVDLRTLVGLQAFLKPGGRMFLFRPTGSHEQLNVPPPLAPGGSIPLVESLRSQLIILEKRKIGRRGVSRGTSTRV
jgi:16S rRNA (guanine527-N7)-methyltransferase